MIKSRNNKGQNTRVDDETIIERMDYLHSKFEYVGGYTGADGFMYVLCKDCGIITKRNAQHIRPSRNRHIECRNCGYILQKAKVDEKRIKSKQHRKEQKEAKFWSETSFEQTTFRHCKRCGNLFFGSRKYCSITCFNSNKNMMRDKYRHLFPLIEVYDKANGACHICGGICDWNDYEDVNGIRIYGNMYPSRDHVVPKSKGGENSWDNIKLAHRICNSIKNDAM